MSSNAIEQIGGSLGNSLVPHHGGAVEQVLIGGDVTKLTPDGWDAYAQALLCANEFCYVD